MELINYEFVTLEEANAFISIVNAGEGYPVLGGDTLTYCEPEPIWLDDIIDGEIIGYSVIKDSVTEKYYV